MRFREWLASEMALGALASARAKAAQERLAPLRPGYKPPIKNVELNPPPVPQPAPPPQLPPEPEFNHEDQQYEDIVAEYLYKIIEDMIRYFFAQNKTVKITQHAIQSGLAKVVNLGSQAAPIHAIQIIVPDTINGVKLPDRFRPMKLTITPTNRDEGASYGSGSIRIPMDITVLQKAQSFDDPLVQKLLAKAQYQLHHESSHISSAQVGPAAYRTTNAFLQNKEGPTLTPEDLKAYIKGKVDYFTDPGEMRAHAKQYAVLYNRHFPGERFDFTKMMSLMHHQQWKIELYFKGFVFVDDKPHPSWGYDVSPYRQQITESGAKFLHMVNFFVKKLLEWRQARNTDQPKPSSGKQITTAKQAWDWKRQQQGWAFIITDQQKKDGIRNALAQIDAALAGLTNTQRKQIEGGKADFPLSQPISVPD